MSDKKKTFMDDITVLPPVSEEETVTESPDSDEGLVHLYAVTLVNNQTIPCIDTRKLADIRDTSPAGYLLFTGDPEVSLGQGLFALDKVLCVVENLTPEYVQELQSDDEGEEEPEIVLPKHGNSSKPKKQGKWS